MATKLSGKFLKDTSVTKSKLALVSPTVSNDPATKEYVDTRTLKGYLQKNTMAEMRAISSTEIADINNGVYIGVMLHGYYAYGDTPAAITYYKSTTNLADDQGSVVVINSNLKLEHKFSVCDVAYYGLQSEINTVEVVDRNTLVINNAIKIAPKVIITKPGKYWCRGNRGGESGSYYRHTSILGTSWNQVGDGNGNPGGINMLSNRTLEMGDGVTLKMRGTFMDAYNFITIWNKENVVIRGGTIIGDYDANPELNEHKRANGTNDGGQWGYGISLQGSKNVLIEDVDISKMWADGINITADYINDFTVNSDIVIRNTKSSKNKRQGMSINGGNRLSFYNCTFAETAGQDPQSGVDIEKDTDIDSVVAKDILFHDCKFLNNYIGARTAQRPTDELYVKFDSCLFEGNTYLDYDSYTGNGVKFTNCRFAYHETRFTSILLVGAQNHTFDKCEFGNAIKMQERVLDVTIYCNNIKFENSTCLNVKCRSTLFNFMDLKNSRNVKIEKCYFSSIELQNDRKFIIADGAKNIEIINNTFKELGWVFDVSNIDGFKFNNNTSINILTTTGVLRTNIKYFELCRNTASGESYAVIDALSPLFSLRTTGNAYGRISDNILYKNPIFATVGTVVGVCTGLYREYNGVSDNITISDNKTYGFTNAEAFQFNVASTNLSVTYLNQIADATYKGLVNRSAAIAAISTANASDPATTQAMVNELKAKFNTLIADQKTAGIITT